MIEPVFIVRTFDHLDLIQFPQGRRDSHEVELPVILYHLIFQAGIDLIPDDEGHKLDKNLGIKGFASVDPLSFIPKIGFIAAEQLL